MENIEVELRGPLDENSYATLKKHLEENGVTTATQKRIFFDLSQTVGINNRELDVRAKVTNDKIQIVVKKALPGSVSREEAEVSIGTRNLKEALHVLALLGYPKGIYGDRLITRHDANGIEFAIQDVISVTDGKVHSRFYEAEILAREGEEGSAEMKLREALSALGLPVFDNAGWDEYEKRINAEANGWFDFSKTDISNFLY